jgi:hypothetical protein
MPENVRRVRSLTIAGCAAIFSLNAFTEVANQLRTRFGAQRRMWSRPTWYQPRTSPRRLNAIIDLLQIPVVYLEIGLNRGKTFESVRAEVRDAVDPFPKIQLGVLPEKCQVFSETSDAFFEKGHGHQSYDLVFVDGLHTWQQTHKDILNSFIRSPKAIILIDDVAPSDAISAIPDFEESLALRSMRKDPSVEWCGDVFKSIEAITRTQPNIKVLTLISPGYPQTMMWLDIPQDGVLPVSHSDNSLDNLKEFEEAFINGMPSYFHPLSDVEGLEVVRRVIKTKF